ncbi:MAG: hypothetical protein DME97_02805 [Verrucomicrobia bacterium]|nr:MAG: hypothetical protein DME97_02805 [Verrucomicrobiota bacterium]
MDRLDLLGTQGAQAHGMTQRRPSHAQGMQLRQPTEMAIVKPTVHLVLQNRGIQFGSQILQRLDFYYIGSMTRILRIDFKAKLCHATGPRALQMS